MSKQQNKTTVRIRFIDLTNNPLPNLYHEVRVSGNKYAASAGKSNAQGLGVWIEKPIGTQLDILVRHPLTDKMVQAKHRIVVTKKGTFRVQAPFSVQQMKLRQLSESGGFYARGTHKVQNGESLYSIAKKYNTTWQVLYNLNKDKIKSADKIYPGLSLKIPPQNSSLRGVTNDQPNSLKSQNTYQVKKGDTLSDISQRSGVSVDELKRINKISNPRKLQAGQKIILRNQAPAPAQNVPTTNNNHDDGFFSSAASTITDAVSAVGDAVNTASEAISNAASSVGNAKDNIAEGIGSLGKKAKKGVDSIGEAISNIGSGSSRDSSVYIVKSGDTLSGIAKQHGVSTQDLIQENGLTLESVIHPNDKLILPSNASSTNTSNTSSRTARSSNPIDVQTIEDDSTDGSPKVIATGSGTCVCKAYDLIWGAKVSCEFRKKVVKISQELWPNDYLAMANNLMALMHLETEGSFDPSKVNSLGFVGLVQMGAGARKDLGVSSDELSNMSAVEQLNWVKKYFQLYGNRYKKIDSFLEMYLTILRPKSVNPEGVDINESEIIFKDNGQERNNPYKQNPAFMKEKGEWKVRGFSGGVTYAWEVKKEIAHHYDDGKKPENRFLKSTCPQVIQPPITINPAESAPWMNIAIREARQWAGYHETKSKSNSNSGSKGFITDNYHKLIGVVVGGDKPYTPSLSTAWCASFINYCLKEANYTYAKDPSSQFPTKYPNKFIKISKPVYGAIVVYKHTNSAYGTGHVSLLYAKLSNGDYAVLGGNQGDSITLNTHQGVYLNELKCKFVGFYIPKEYKATAEKLMENGGGFGEVISLSKAKKSINDSTGVTLTTK